MDETIEERAARGDLRAYTMGEWLAIYLKMLPAMLVAGLIVGTMVAVLSSGMTMLAMTVLVGAGTAVTSATGGQAPSSPSAKKVRACSDRCTEDATSSADHGFFDAGTCSCVEDGKVTTVIGRL